MKKRILSTILSLFMTLTMVMSLLPVQMVAQGLTNLSHAAGQNTALRSTAVQNIGPTEAAVENDLHEKMSAQVSTITLINDIELGGCLSIYYEVTIDLNGHVLKIADDRNDRVIKIAKDGHLILTDGRPTAEHKFTPNDDGLWVLDETGGTEIVKGGIITGGNTGGADGGGVYIEPGGRFTMNGGSIVGCQARSQYNGTGGGVKVECETDPDSGIISNGTFTMNDGAIIGCVARHGGGVETNGGSEGENGTFTMNGGVIDSCVAADGMGGGVQNDGLFIMGKDATIKNCKAFQDGQYYLGSGASFTGDRQILNGEIVSGDANDKDYIFVNRGTVTIGANAKIQANIFCSNGTIALADGVTSTTVYGKITNGRFADGLVAVTYKVNGTDYATQILKSGSAAIRPADPAVPAGRTFDGWYKTDGRKWDFSTAVTKNTTLAGWLYVPVTNETELTAALQDDTVGMIRLVDNITLPRLKMSIIIRDGRELILDLGGHVLDLGENTGISVGGDTVGIMTIMDSSPDAPHKFTPDADGLWVWDETGGTKTVLGGVITGSSEGSLSSAICVGGSDGKVIMDGGNIVGHRTGDGGAVSITAGGRFTMNGGSITGCYASGKGGAVYVVVGKFEMAGGVIKSCTAASDGGAVRVSNKDGTFTMTGGSIEGCTATYGSGVYLNGGKMNANGGTVDGTVVLDVKNNGDKGIIQGSGSTATHFSGAVTNYGEIRHGTFSDTVTLGNSNQIGKITGGIFNGPVTTALEGEAAIGGGVFNKTVTIYRGEITNGTFNKDVVVYNVLTPYRCTTLAGGTYNGLIINKSADAAFAGAHSPLGIVETKPSSQYSNDRYRTVTFDPAGGHMDYPVRYFLDDGNISNQIVPDSRVGYFFAGWYNGENKWNYSDTVGEDDLTLTAHWTACDHSGHTGAQPTCTTSVTCTACGGEIAKLGHDWGAWTSNGNGTHIHICQRDNTHTETKDCFGGEATCKEKAVCTDCGKAYGDLDPANHKGGKQEWTQTKTTHEKKWNCCGAVIVASEAHEWANGECQACGYKCLHDDADKNHICDICKKIISNHEDANKDHICDFCEKVISNHEDTDKNHICDFCEKIISNHVDADKNHVCDHCDKAISNHEDANKDHICDYCNKIISNHVDTDKNHVCDFCEKVISNHEDTDKNHICDYCEKIISNHADADKDHICDFCGKVITNHAGGKATCKDKAGCEVCGKAYGELDANNHAGLKHMKAKAATKDAEGNTEYWYCEGCGKYYGDAKATKEITEADTLIAKLPNEPKAPKKDAKTAKQPNDPKSPKTGDTTNPLLWIALLFVSGGAVIGRAAIGKKKRYNS